jgi:Cu/Ag efflux protein CusF
MKSQFVLLMIAAACAASPAMAQQLKAEGAAAASSSPGKAQVARAVKVSATVSAIDKASRTITLKDAAGKEFPVVAGSEVRNFDQITVGSEVVVGMMQALALELKKGPGGAPTMVESADSARAASGAQPGAVAARKVTVTADVIALDAKTQTATLKGPKQTVDLKVPDPKQFKMIAVGDQIQATYTEALAISVEPAKKK